DVDTSDLGRGARLRGLPARALGLRRRVLAATASHRSRAERDPGREREQDARRHRPPDPNLPTAPLPPALAITRVRFLLSHRKGQQAYGALDGCFWSASQATALES